jgi:Fic family protein
MLKHKNKIRSELRKIYSQDLLNNIFRHPYTKIEFVMKDLSVSRITATRYLDELALLNILNKQKLGRENYYINTELFNLLGNVKV